MDRQTGCNQIIRQNDDTLMVLSIHHALYDADSLSMILDDFDRALRSLSIGSADDIESTLTTNLSAVIASSKTSKTFWSTALQNAA